MVRIPTFDSQRQLSVGTTASRITDIASFTKQSAALERTGRVLNTIAEDFKKLETLRQVSKATVETNRILTEKEAQFLDNPNLTESDVTRFNQEADQEITNQLATINDESARLRAGVSFRGTAVVKGINVKRQGRQADIDTAVVQSVEVTSQFLQDSFAAGPVEREIIRENLRIHFNNNALANLTTKKQAQIDLAAFDEALRKGRGQFMLDSMTAATEGRTIEDRIAGARVFIGQVNAGSFDELSTSEQQTLINNANNFVERWSKINENKIIEEQKVNEQNDIEGVVDGNFTETQMREKELRQEWSSVFTNNALAYNTSEKAPPVATDFGEYVRIRKMQTELETKDDGTAFTQEEVIAEVLRIGNDSLSGSHQKDLVNKSFDLIKNRSDSFQKNNVINNWIAYF